MRSQIRDEKEEKEKYGTILSRKDFQHWNTIDRRDTFRSMRHTLHRLNLDLNIPMNLVDFSHKYCLDYGDSSIEKIKTAPTGWNKHARR